MFAATLAEARREFAAHRPTHEMNGAIVEGALAYLPWAFRQDYGLAMDAQPALQTDPNSGIPYFLTTFIDPEVYKILFAPNKAAIIFSERRKGTWVDQTAMFPVVEHAGEVSSYDDYSESGRVTANTNWPQRQAYLYQTIMSWGELELARAGLGRINWVSELNESAATAFGKYENFIYFFGVVGLQNYGLLNDPNLALVAAPLAPLPKGYGGTKWIVGSATANEIFADIELLFQQLVVQTAGLVDRQTKMTLALSPLSEATFTTTNAFGLNVSDMLKKNFPNMRVETAVQYQALSASNPQGQAAGNLVQLIADKLEGQATGYMAFNEKLRTHPIIRAVSSFKQKRTGGAWGAVIRLPVAIAQMSGV